MFIFGGLRLLGLLLFLHAQDIIRNGNLSYPLGYHLSRIIISRGLLIIVNCSRSLIWLHIVIGNLWCVLTDSDNPFTIKEEVLVYLSLGVLLGGMLDVTLPALLLDLIHLHTFNE